MERHARTTAFVALICLALAPAAPAITIADFSGDFQDVTPGTGWQYLWNSLGPLGNSASYTPLVWNTAFGGVYAVNPFTFPDSVEGYTALSDAYSHPGLFGKYVIGAYTVQPGEEGILSVTGFVEMLDLNRLPDNSDGLDLQILLGNSVVGSFSVPVSPVLNFSTLVGPASAGLQVYVAVGPKSHELYDAFRIDYEIDSQPVPEPASLFLLGSGVAAMAARRRRGRPTNV